MNSPRVTIITATYNWSSVLPYAIASAQRQSYTNWEMLIVGDCCTDDSAEVVERARNGDERVRWINLPENNGEQSAPNNEGLRQARGELIAYLGHDDLWYPHHLECLVNAIDGGADLVYSLVELIMGPEVVPPERLHSEFPLPTSVMHRKSVTDVVGGWSHYRDIYDSPQGHLWTSVREAGFRIEMVPRMSAIKLPAVERRGIYKIRPCDEQAHWSKRIDTEPDLEVTEMTKLALELQRVNLSERQMGLRQKVLRSLRDMPKKIRHNREQKKRKIYKGSLIDENRRIRGLDTK